METSNKSNMGASRAACAGQGQNFLSLDKLITEIDNEMALPFDATTIKQEIGPDLAEAPTDLQNQYILLALEKTHFALPLCSALEIGRRPVITPLPNLPNWVLGISNVRGEIISFINLKAFFGITSTGTKSERRFLIIYNQDLKVGIIVDRILGILSLNKIDTDLQRSPYRKGEIASFITGVAISRETPTNILDVDKLLSCARMTQFK